MERLPSLAQIQSILYKANFCRSFELNVQKAVDKRIITCPVYLSIGQELTPAIFSEFFPDALIFAQHRAHSTYLCFGGNPDELIQKLLNSKEGSASIQIKGRMVGHSGFMGDQVPIAVGAAFNTNKPVITFMGDASAEEDYVFGAMGFASTKKLPIIFVVEDNNLSILTEKKVRRNWEITSVSEALKIPSFTCNDSISELGPDLLNNNEYPLLFNVLSTRLCWHAGSGMNNYGFDRLKEENEVYKTLREIQTQGIMDANNLWKKYLT